MRESDLVATMTVHYASDGEGAVVAGANTVSAAQDRVSASAQALATATESAQRRQVSAAAAFDALSRRMDPAARAFADLERNQNTFNRALAANSSIVDKAGQGLDVYAAKLKAAEAAAHGLLVQQENMRRQQSNLTTDASATTGSINGAPVSLNQITGSQLSNVNVREYAAQFEAAAAAMETAAHAKAMQIGQAFGASLNESLIAGVGKSARESASVFTAELDRLDEISNQKALQVGKNFVASLDASLIAGVGKSARDSASVFTAELDRLDDIARQRATQIGKNFQDSLNQSFGIGSSGKSARDSAAVFQEAAAAEDKMVDASNRLKAALNPLAAEEAKQVEWLGLMKQAQQAGIITAEQFAGAQQLSVTRLANLSQSLKTAGTAGRVMSGEMTNLGFQLNDIVTGLALGQSPFMILGQQGGQVIQIFANSKASIADFARSSVNWFTSLFTVGRVAFGGIAAAVGTAAYAMNAFATSQREAGQALIGVGARTGTTISQINDFAKENATATGLSVDQARTVAVEFTKTGNIAVSGLKGVGDAIHGFSVLTGQDATEATKFFAKALSGDAVEAAREFNKTYGFLNSSTMEYIRTLELSGDHSKAIQVIMDGMAKDNLKAADSVGVLSKAWDAFANGASRVKNAIGSIGAAASLQDQLKEAEARRDAIQNSPSPLGSNPGGYGMLNTGSLAGGGAELKAAALAEAARVVADLNEKLKLENADNAVKKLNQMSAAGDDVVRSIIPQIAQLEKLKEAEKALQDAQNTPGVKINTAQSDAALLANRNQQAATQGLIDDDKRYNQRVQEISQSWGGVSQKTALILQGLQNQLPVVEAVTEAARMEAQYRATIATLVDKGTNSEEAQLIAAKQLEQSQAAATSNVKKQVLALEDSTKMIQAQQDGTEAATAAAIAYTNAIESGASATAAAALSAATLANYMARAAAAAQQMAAAESAAATAAYNKAGGNFGQAGGYSSGDSSVAKGTQYTSTSNLGSFIQLANTVSQSTSDIISSSLTGGVDAAIAKLKTTQISANPLGLLGSYEQYGLPSKGTQGDITSAIMSLYDLKNTQAGNDTAAKMANYQDEIAFLQKQPATIANMKAIADLTTQMQSLGNSTDSLNTTMKDALSPYYTQDPRTSHIGFRSQGMALGGEFTVPGSYSSNDNMLASIPVASGEIVSVRRPGQNSDGSSHGISVTNHITISGNANKEEVGRTFFQLGQTMRKQLKASSQ